jgi:8-oxo-dGTP pyrophosphatase MutT (NUDIX family)
MRDTTLRVVDEFDVGDDGLAAKSRELVHRLLSQSAEPFSAKQFCPGHITCTALIFHPEGDADESRVLMIHHHRLKRWLLPGGHVEQSDLSPDAVAAREAEEETRVEIDRRYEPFLAGIDVHGIPPKQDAPYHLHHDLIWCFRASTERFEITAEAREVTWARESDWDRLEVAPSIRNSIRRARRVAGAAPGYSK